MDEMRDLVDAFQDQLPQDSDDSDMQSTGALEDGD